MANQQSSKSLQEEFPDMSQSIIGDVLNIYKGDQKAAAAALGGMDKETKMENEKKVKELRELFPFASEQDCKNTLTSVNWDVEAAIVPLFNRGEELKQKARKEKEAELVRKRETEAKKQSDNLLEIFKTIPKNEIQKLLDENEGDIEETTTQLLGIVAQQEEEKVNKTKETKDTKDKEASIKAEEKRMQEEQEMRLRELKIQALEEKFEDLAEKEVILALEAADWDIKRAHMGLMKVSAEKKKKYLKSLFPSVRDDEIESALDNNEWDKGRAATYLTEHLREKRASPVVVKKVTHNNLLERSMVFAQQIEDQVTQSHADFERALKEESMANFKRDLEHIMKVQARHGVAPGMAPLLVKQIDTLLNKPQPLLDDQQPQQQQQQEQSSKQFTDAPQPDSGKYQVILTAPSHVDIGNSITVQWEMTAGESTSNDWIGMFSVDQQNKQYVTYEWRGKNDSQKGSVTFTAPNVYGAYEFRYFVNRSYQHVAISNTLTVGPKVELNAQLADSGKILVDWNQLSGNKYSRAWVGFYEKSQTNNKLYITWEYATTAQLTFAAPVKPKEYEFRFFTNSYIPVATSNSILIEGEDRVSASISNGLITVKPHVVSVDPYYDAVWMGVFFTSEKDHRQWRRYKYVTDRDAEVTFKAPNTPGEYEVRLFANKTYDLLVKSGPFLIEKK